MVERAASPAHASIDVVEPINTAAARAFAERFRNQRQQDVGATICRSDLDALSGDRGEMTRWGEEFLEWLEALCNFYLHFRRVFRVDESISWMLGATELDLSIQA